MIFDYRTQYHEYRGYLERLKQQVKSPVAQVSFTIVGTFFLVGFLGMVAIRPTLSTIADLTRSIDDEKRNVDLLDRKIRSLQLAQQKLESFQNELPVLQTAVPETVDLTGIARRIEALAHEDGLLFLEFAQNDILLYPLGIPTVTINQPLIASSIPIHITIGGDEEVVRRFIDDVERLDRINRVTLTRLDLVPPKSRRERPFPITASITLEFFTTQRAPVPLPTGTTAKQNNDAPEREASPL